MSKRLNLTTNHPLNEAVPQAVLDALHDPTRICPMLAGSALIEGNKLTVRTSTQTIMVNATNQLFKALFELADGTRTLAQLHTHIEKTYKDGEFAQTLIEFIAFLLDEGALIDGNFACIEASQYAHQTSPVGTVADKALTNRIARRFLEPSTDAQTQTKESKHALPIATIKKSGLDRFFAGRYSCRTFDDQAISLDALHELLWSAAGVVDHQHPHDAAIPRRTLGSGGAMHLLEVYVVLKQTVGERKTGQYKAGVYRVHYPAARTVQLEPITQDHQLLLRAFIQPADVTFATGAIFLIAQPKIAAIRYRTRAMQYLWMESGAALQNTALTAGHLGLGHAVIGGYTEEVVLKLLNRQDTKTSANTHTNHDLDYAVFGAAIFGSKPTATQRAQADAAPNFAFNWVNEASDIYPMHSHLARTQLTLPSIEKRAKTWGRSTVPYVAMLKAQAEAIEREGFYAPQNITIGTFDKLGATVDPHAFCQYSQAQYQQTGFRYQAFDRKHRYAWTKGVDWLTKKPSYVLADWVFARSALEAKGYPIDRPFGLMTSTGCAAGHTKTDAVLRGLLEVLERDAFMRHWLTQTGGEIVAAKSYPPTITQAITAIERTGAKVLVQRLPSRWAQVALVSVQHEAKHFTTMATSANLSFERALLGALDEIETRVFGFIHDPAIEIPNPQDVVGPEDHYRLYADKRYYRKADCVLFPDLMSHEPLSLKASQALFETATPSDSTHKAKPNTTVDLKALMQQFQNTNDHPIVVDMTPAHNSVDQGRTPLTVVKVLVPHCIPLWFGAGYEPLGMSIRMPVTMRQYNEVTALQSKFFPHPFP